jgi:broad specificity phosphatase PhoE
MSILFIRHGSTALNEGGAGQERTRGWSEAPLSPKGHQEAQQAAQMTAPYPLKAIITSDLQRAQDTAGYVSQYHPGVPVIPTSTLRPWDVGDYTGKIYTQVKPLLNQHLQTPDQKIPGGESFYDFANRSLPLLQVLRDSPNLFGVVSHNWNGRLLRGQEASQGTELDHGKVSEDNPVKPGHLMLVDQQNGITHIKPPAGPPVPPARS